jgi:hypothetical protein
MAEALDRAVTPPFEPRVATHDPRAAWEQAYFRHGPPDRGPRFTIAGM